MRTYGRNGCQARAFRLDILDPQEPQQTLASVRVKVRGAALFQSHLPACCDAHKLLVPSFPAGHAYLCCFVCICGACSRLRCG